MTKDEMLEWQKFPLGNQALQVLDKIHSEKIMISNDLYDGYNNLFSFKTNEYIRALPVWQEARLGEIIKALFKRGYLEKINPVHNFDLNSYVDQIVQKMKAFVPDIESSFSLGRNLLVVNFPSENLERNFDLRNDYFSFISAAGIQALLDSQQRLELIKEKKGEKQQWIVPKYVNCTGEILPGVGRIMQAISQTKDRVYVRLETPEGMADLLANQDWGSAVEKKTRNTVEYLFVRKQNILADSVDPEQYKHWAQMCIKNKYDQATLQREETLDIAVVQRKYAAKKQEMAAELDRFLSQEVSILTKQDKDEEGGFVLTETSNFNL